MSKPICVSQMIFPEFSPHSRLARQRLASGRVAPLQMLGGATRSRAKLHLLNPQHNHPRGKPGYDLQRGKFASMQREQTCMPALKCLLTWQCSSQVPGLSVISSAEYTFPGSILNCGTRTTLRSAAG